MLSLGEALVSPRHAGREAVPSHRKKGAGVWPWLLPTSWLTPSAEEKET